MVEIANVALVAPAVTVTVLGTAALAELLVRLIVVPAAGAAPLRLTTPEAEVPPLTLVGVIATEVRESVVISRSASRVRVPTVPLILARVLAPTDVVETVNEAEVAPAGTETEGGTVADALLLAKVTVVPPEGAAWFNVAVPVDEPPPRT